MKNKCKLIYSPRFRLVACAMLVACGGQQPPEQVHTPRLATIHVDIVADALDVSNATVVITRYAGGSHEELARQRYADYQAAPPKVDIAGGSIAVDAELPGYTTGDGGKTVDLNSDEPTVQIVVGADLRGAEWSCTVKGELENESWSETISMRQLGGAPMLKCESAATIEPMSFRFYLEGLKIYGQFYSKSYQGAVSDDLTSIDFDQLGDNGQPFLHYHCSRGSGG